MYLQIKDNYWACDIEGDLIPSTKIWCLCAVNVKSGEEISITDTKEIADWVSRRKADGAKFIFHNGLGYDAPTLNRILRTKLVVSDIIDTMILSMLYSPSLDGGHSLAAWGTRLKFPKSEHSDFSQLTDEMLAYCLQDARLCRRIFVELVRRMLRAGFTEQGIELEHRSWHLIQKQKENGFAFNIKEAHTLYAKLRGIEQEIERQIHEIWPPVLQIVGTYKRPYKQNGEPSANLLRHREQYERVEIREDRLEYDCYGRVAFNIGSPIQRTEKLVELGWNALPNERTPTGLPKPTSKGKLVPSLIKFVEENEHPGPRLIAKWMEINARANMINTWIEAFNESTGAIHGTLWLANTLRYRHSNPNTANIPAVRLDKEEKPLRGEDGVFTYEARDLWTTRDPDNRRLVGTDAKGIQLRVLAHYLNNPDFSHSVLEGDPHAYNQQIGGFETRAIAKTFIYAFLLGAGDEKVGQIIGGSPRDGKQVKQRFIANFPGLSELLERLGQEVERRGRIVLCDGTPIIVTQPHTRLGYLLQGDESRIMKRAAILTDREIRRRGLDVLKVCDVHDEFQFDVFKDHVDEFQNLLPMCFKASGEYFNYRVPIDCDSKVGLTWSETH